MTDTTTIRGVLVTFDRAPWDPRPDELFTYRVECPSLGDDPTLLGFVRDTPHGWVAMSRARPDYTDLPGAYPTRETAAEALITSGAPQ